MDFDEAYDDTNSSVGLAARRGNVVLLKELLQNGHPTNGHDNRGWRPLHEAAEKGHTECVRLLLAAEDASVDALSHAGVTALQLACSKGPNYTDIVKRMLCAGADPNMKQGDDWELPLPKAIAGNLIDIVRLLLDAGADPSRKDYGNGAPLLVAAEHGLLEIGKLLLERGACASWKDDVDRTALHVLMFPPLLQRGDSTIVPFINLLVDNGCDVNVQMSDGTTPLMLAVQTNLEETVTRLLELGANPNITKDDGVMALHFAIEFCPDMSEEAENSLHFIPEISDDDIGEMVILKKILSLTAKDAIIPSSSQYIKYSIFHLAIEWDRFNSLKTLLAAGLPPDKFLQETANAALDEADVNLCCQVPLVVIDLGTEVDTPLGFLLSKPLNSKRVRMAKYMIDKGSSINAVNPKCLPPLVAAIKHQRADYDRGSPGLEIIEYFLEKGVDVMHKIRSSDVLPAALHISSLFNVSAFFALLLRCIPVSKTYTPETLEALSYQYKVSSYYALYPLFPWRVISWLSVVNMFIPQLPLDTKTMFDINRMVDDESLTVAWTALDNVIGSPKKLEHLCVLTIRQAVGESSGWRNLPKSLEEVTLMNEPLPEIIMDLLQFKQVNEKSLYQWPPLVILPKYLMPTCSSSDWSSDSEAEDPNNQAEVDRLHDMGREDRIVGDDNDRVEEMVENRSPEQSDDDDSGSETESVSTSEDSNDNEDEAKVENALRNENEVDERDMLETGVVRKKLKTDDT